MIRNVKSKYETIRIATLQYEIIQIKTLQYETTRKSMRKKYEMRFISKHFVLHFVLSFKVSIRISDVPTNSSEFWSSDPTFSCDFAATKESTQYYTKLYRTKFLKICNGLRECLIHSQQHPFTELLSRGP